ncbi:uncharacterized protein LOC116308329 [Actinia tenebrosa]|uniref:Uncharacterized protein LOC116308329 n=1 Tax=Actinia tenebrosa TaxID=6105 RepID=A0A6P8J4L0_ACTTE|nr:uncharacterized protein LOC116308329 [Actinia tenebrosa]
MASSGSWLLFSFMLVIFALSFRTSLSLRCERGEGNCVEDELALGRHLKKRAIRPQNCRFSCIGRKRETDEKKPLKIPENEKLLVDKVIDDILLKREPVKREKVLSSRPPCQRFSCGGKKRSAKSPENEIGTANEMTSKRNPLRLAGCSSFDGCKRIMEKETFSLPKKLQNSETKNQRQKEGQEQEQDSKSSCFRFGCKKREQSGEERPGLPVAPNEKTQEAIPAVDQDNNQETRCWRFGCGKRSNLLQTLAEKISKRFNEKPNELRQFGQENQERKTQ